MSYLSRKRSILVAVSVCPLSDVGAEFHVATRDCLFLKCLFCVLLEKIPKHTRQQQQGDAQQKKEPLILNNNKEKMRERGEGGQKEPFISKLKKMSLEQEVSSAERERESEWEGERKERQQKRSPKMPI